MQVFCHVFPNLYFQFYCWLSPYVMKSDHVISLIKTFSGFLRPWSWICLNSSCRLGVTWPHLESPVFTEQPFSDYACGWALSPDWALLLISWVPLILSMARSEMPWHPTSCSFTRSSLFHYHLLCYTMQSLCIYISMLVSICLPHWAFLHEDRGPGISFSLLF